MLLGEQPGMLRTPTGDVEDRTRAGEMLSNELGDARALRSIIFEARVDQVVQLGGCGEHGPMSMDDHSALSTRAGSTRLARRAGKSDAIAHTASSSSDAPKKVSGSAARTPKSSDCSSRVATSARTRLRKIGRAHV